MGLRSASSAMIAVINVNFDLVPPYSQLSLSFLSILENHFVDEKHYTYLQVLVLIFLSLD